MTVWYESLGELLIMGLLLERTVAMTGRVQRQFQGAATAESAFWSVHSIIDEAGRNREPAGGALRPRRRQPAHSTTLPSHTEYITCSGMFQSSSRQARSR
jgi:hypothetical protein